MKQALRSLSSDDLELEQVFIDYDEKEKRVETGLRGQVNPSSEQDRELFDALSMTNMWD